MAINPVELAQPTSKSRGVAIALQELRQSYAGRDVLKSIRLDIAPGEFVAVVGRSGCGKSTLLRLVAGLEQPSAGRIAFKKNGSPHRPEVRLMFQDSRLLPWKRVLDNVALGLSRALERFQPDRHADTGRLVCGTALRLLAVAPLRRVAAPCSAGNPPRPRRAGQAETALGKAAQALEKVGLKERAGEWPAVLSGGQRQRVALARALVHDPELLLLDEPLGALDALTRIEMQQLIETLWQQRGFTALLVTHDVQEAVALADRVILIEDGRITFDERIDLPRPRARGSALLAQLEEQWLERVLKHPPSRPDGALGDVSLLTTVSQVGWAV